MSSVLSVVFLVTSHSHAVYTPRHFTDPHFATVVIALDPRWQLAQRSTPT